MKLVSSTVPAQATFMSDEAFKRWDFQTNTGCGDVPNGHPEMAKQMQPHSRP